MSSSSALCGLLLLLCGSAVPRHRSGPVIYSRTQICAVEGSAVTISCRFSHPIRGQDAVLQTLWFLNGRPVDPRSDPEFRGRVQTLCNSTACSLRLTGLRESDSGRYRFWSRTSSGSYSGSPGVSLTVAVLRVQLLESNYQLGFTRAHLKCVSSCRPDHQSYIWIRNRREILNQTSASVSASVRPADTYSCSLEGNQEFPSPSVYAPLPPSVSVSPSAEVQEGSSVTLTCSSDANPAASYSWYKEDEESPRAAGRSFIITDVRPEHSGNYSCKAENTRGSQSSTVHLEVKGSRSAAAAGSAALLLPVVFLSVCLWIRKRRSSKEPAELRADELQQEDPEQQDELLYATVHFIRKQPDGAAQSPRGSQRYQDAAAAATGLQRVTFTPRSRHDDTREEPAALYSTVTTTGPENGFTDAHIFLLASVCCISELSE